MKRSAAVLPILLCCALAAGCGGEAAEPEETVTVYSISGTSEQMTLSNGILVLTDTEQTLDGGDLTYRPAEPADAAGYATEIYLLSGGERKPLISMKEGEIFPEGMTRSRKKAFDRIISMARNFFKDSGEIPEQYTFASGYGYDYDECVAFKNQLVASMKSYCHIDDMEIYQIGATIGVHTGPYPLGMGFLKRFEYV